MLNKVAWKVTRRAMRSLKMIYSQMSRLLTKNALAPGHSATSSGSNRFHDACRLPIADLAIFSIATLRKMHVRGPYTLGRFSFCGLAREADGVKRRTLHVSARLPLSCRLPRSELRDELLEFSQAAFQLLHILGFRPFRLRLPRLHGPSGGC